MEATRITVVHRRILDELEGDEFVPGELQHRQGAELGRRHLAHYRVAEGGVERDRAPRVCDPETDVQGSHDGFCRADQRGPADVRSRTSGPAGRKVIVNGPPGPRSSVQ